MSLIHILLCDSTHAIGEIAAANTIPLGIGMVGSYLKSRFEKEIEVTLCKFPDKTVQYIKQNKYKMVGFSNYIWNIDLSYKFAELAKFFNPDTVIVFGGPNYPDNPEEQAEFLRERPIIDFYLYKEAEIVLENLIKSLINNNWDINKTRTERIASCHFYDGMFAGGGAPPRISDLDSIQSPYTSGMLDEFLDGRLIPLIQTNRGCPFSCTYCSEGGSYHKRLVSHSVERIYEDLTYIAERYRGPNSLFISDSNFGMYKRDVDICHKIADVQLKYNWPKYINVATGKNQKKRVIECASIIGGALRLGASVQTTDHAVLKNIKRENLSVKDIISIGQSASSTGANTYSEVILSLPGETKESHFHTIRDIVEAGLNFIRCYTLMLLPAAEIASPESRKRFGIVSRYRILPRCFGEYRINGKTIKSAEIEEVCVASNTMSFDDYVECRCLHLSVELFYNDGVFRELFTFANNKNINTFDLLLHIHNSALTHHKLKQLYSMFTDETKNELWVSKEELSRNFIENAEKYYRGETGANLIFKYKTIGLCGYLEEMHEIAFGSLHEIIKDSTIDVIETDYLEDLKAHCIAKKYNLFSTDEMLKRELRFDMVKAEKHNFKIDPSALIKNNGCKIIYFHAPEQKAAIKKHLDVLGTDMVGKARIFANIKVIDMYRKCDYDS